MLPESAAMPSRYKSCAYIESALIFHPRVLYHCCIPVNGRFGSTDICRYHGGPLPIAAILKSREEYRRKLSEPENHPNLHCAGCVNAHFKNWSDENEYLFHTIHFNNSFICNLSCNFCVQRGIPAVQQRPDYETLPVVKEIMASRHVAPNAFVFWAGGEPALLPDFPEALTLMCEHGARNEVATNATVFCEAIHKLLKPGGNLVIKTSVDCGTRETFLALKQKDFFDTVWQNLRRYAETGGEVSAKYIVSHDNADLRDLDGFAEQMRRAGLRRAHIDINHNFRPEEVTDRHVEAAKYLYENLISDGVAVDIGVHATAAVPGFAAKVMERINRPAGQIRAFEQRAAEYFEDVQPPELPEECLVNSRLIANRVELLKRLPKGGVCAEVGTQTGYFARKIQEILQPKMLHIYDLDLSIFDRTGWEEDLRNGVVDLHEGDSSTLLALAPDSYFDFIYIDGDHSYEGVRKDLAESVKKLKPGGHIVCNDYTAFSPLEGVKYGVSRAVNEFCIEHDFEIVFFGLHLWGYHDVALRRRESGCS